MRSTGCAWWRPAHCGMPEISRHSSRGCIPRRDGRWRSSPALKKGRLIHLGVVSNEPAARGRCLLIDLGGGSCEITLSDHSAIREMVSVPLGAVRLTREFLRHDPARPEEVVRMQDWIRRELRRAEQQIGRRAGSPVFATSGTAAALALATQAHVKVKSKARSKARKVCRSITKKNGSAGVGADLDGGCFKAGGQIEAHVPGAAECCSRHRAETLGDHRRRRACIRGDSGKISPCRVSGILRWDCAMAFWR